MNYNCRCWVFICLITLDWFTMVVEERIIKRLKIRSWRRGMKEMDIILGKFIDQEVQTMDNNEIATYENLLNNDDQTIFSWLLNKEKTPEEFNDIIKKISKFTFLKT